MSKILALISGDLAQGNGPVPENREPYRTIWNSQVVSSNPGDYIRQESAPEWPVSVQNTAVLTHHEPLDYEPIMLCENGDPLDRYGSPYPVFSAESPYLRGSPAAFRIENITDIANPDRRGKLPKVFQLRMGSETPLDPLDLLRYNLNSTGSRFIALRADAVGDQVLLHVRVCLDGQTVLESPAASYGPWISFDTGYTIRMIIFDNRVVIHLGNPGTEVASLAIPSRVTVENGASLDIFRLDSPGATPNRFVLDGLYIYDGYY